MVVGEYLEKLFLTFHFKEQILKDMSKIVPKTCHFDQILDLNVRNWNFQFHMKSSCIS